MKTIYTSILVLFLLTGNMLLVAQVAINTDGSTPNSSAMLDIKSNTAGILIPRMTAAQRDAISTPAQGLMVFVTDDNSFYYYDGSTWQAVGRGTSGWDMNSSIVYADSTHPVVIGNTTTAGTFEVVTDKATGTYTTDRCTGGTASALEYQASYVPAHAFDDDQFSLWRNNGSMPVWIQYDFGSGNEKAIARYRLYWAGADLGFTPQDWQFQASNDETNWTTLDSRTGETWTNGVWKEFTLSNITHYRYYRVNITQNNGASNNGVYLDEIEMQEMIYSNHPTLFVADNKVGIGTESPAATLDVKGSLKYADGTQSTGNILTTDADGNATWANGDTLNVAGWTKSGDTIYNTTANVGIGTSTPNAKLNINNSSADTSVSILNNSGSNLTHYGIYSTLSGTGTGQQCGNLQYITNSGNSTHFGTYNGLTGTGTGVQYGSYQTLSNSGSGVHYGSYNKLTGAGTGSQYGSYQYIDNSGSDWHYGTFNILSGTGSGYQIASYQGVDNSGNAEHYGTLTNLAGSGTGVQYGNRQNIINSGNASHYGTYNKLTGTGTGNKYGFYDTISNTARGTHYGVYSVAEGASNYAGYFKGNVYMQDKLGIGTFTPNAKVNIYNNNSVDTTLFIDDSVIGNNVHVSLLSNIQGTGWSNQSNLVIKNDNTGAGAHYGCEVHLSNNGQGRQRAFHVEIDNSGDGAHIGYYTRLDGSGTGDKYGVRSYIPTVTGGVHYGVYSSAEGASNYAGYFEGNVYAQDNVGIGTDSPDQKLDVRGDMQIKDTVGPASLILDGASGNSSIAFTKSGAFGGSLGYNSDLDYLFFYNGGNVVVKDGKLGVGTTTPVAKLEVQNSNSDTSLFITNSSTASTNRFGNFTLLTGTGTGKQYGIYDTIPTSAGGTHYGVYSVAEGASNYAGYFKGNVEVTKKVKAPVSGDADMKAYIYGTLNADGSIVSDESSTGFTSTFYDPGSYAITFDNYSNDQAYIVVANAYRTYGPATLTIAKNNGFFWIRAWNVSGDQMNIAFNFVVYKK